MVSASAAPPKAAIAEQTTPASRQAPQLLARTCQAPQWRRGVYHRGWRLVNEEGDQQETRKPEKRKMPVSFEKRCGPLSEPGTHLSTKLAPGQGVLASHDDPQKHSSPPFSLPKALAGGRGQAWCPAACAQTALTWVPACRVAPSSCTVLRSVPSHPSPSPLPSAMRLVGGGGACV